VALEGAQESALFLPGTSKDAKLELTHQDESGTVRFQWDLSAR
jgi:hypothetical protein